MLGTSQYGHIVSGRDTNKRREIDFMWPCLVRSSEGQGNIFKAKILPKDLANYES